MHAVCIRFRRVCIIFHYIGSVYRSIHIWLGGIVPQTGQVEIDNIAKISVETAQKPFDNLVVCAYDACCDHNMTNTTCHLDTNGVPNHESVAMQHRNDTVNGFEEADHFCDMFSAASCSNGVVEYRKDVGRIIYDWFMPFAYIIVSISGILFFAWLFALVEICWCCGESDIDRTKITPEDDDDY